MSSDARSAAGTTHKIMGVDHKAVGTPHCPQRSSNVAGLAWASGPIPLNGPLEPSSRNACPTASAVALRAAATVVAPDTLLRWHRRHSTSSPALADSGQVQE